MTSLRIMFVILIVTLGLVLAAGCMGMAGDEKNIGNVPSTVLITSSIPAPAQIQTYQVPPDGYWINIDPISDKFVGESFTITSTTNLSAGEEILVQVYSGTHFNGPKIQTWEFYGATGSVKVIQGNRGINTISFVVNSSTLYNSSPLQPDEYIVTEDAIIQPVTGTALFNVIPAPVSYGKTPLKTKNFIDWEKLDLPTFKVNNSMQPENPSFANSDSDPCQTTNGSIILFSTDGIVRIFDKNGAQTGACYDSRDFHSHGVPSGTMIDIRGNVTTVFYGGERILTEIHEAGD